MKRPTRLLGLCLALGLGLALAPGLQAGPSPLQGQMPSVLTVPPEARSGPGFDPEAATKAYLAQIPAAATARSDAYFEGGYWLILWDFLYGAAVSLLLLATGLSAWMRRQAERLTRFRFLQTGLYWAQFSVATFVLGFPLSVYEGFFREHRYGLATQGFGGWMGDELKGLLVGILLGGLAVAGLFAIVRRLPRTWWLWGAGASLAMLVVAILIGPVFLQPIFNTPKKLDNPAITGPILSLARANGIPAHDVYEIDASRQTNRMSANVSGFGSTMRITLNDNLIRRGSPEEIQAVMGHEMGHYVLNHILKFIQVLLILLVAMFGLLKWSLERALARWGGRWGITGLADPAILPLVVLVASSFFFVLTPVVNTIVRTQEAEADIFGVNASAQPDGFAQAAIHLGEYRKMCPTPLEEALFFDHPSGRARIHMAMQWKAEHPSPAAPPAGGAPH